MKSSCQSTCHQYDITKGALLTIARLARTKGYNAKPITKCDARQHTQYYRDMWVKRSEMLAPLSDLVAECGEMKTTKKNKVKKTPWKWDPIHQAVFDCVKATITKEVVLAYPDFSKPFEIYTDASTLQLGAVITQDNRPIAFFSRKLSETQTRYTITEIELLAIVETLKEFISKRREASLLQRRALCMLVEYFKALIDAAMQSELERKKHQECS